MEGHNESDFIRVPMSKCPPLVSYEPPKSVFLQPELKNSKETAFGGS